MLMCCELGVAGLLLDPLHIAVEHPTQLDILQASVIIIL